MAKTAFKEGMNDENVSVKIGSDPDSSVEPTEPDEPDVSTKKYTLKDLVYDKWPTSGKISVKKALSDKGQGRILLFFSDNPYLYPILTDVFSNCQRQ